jgi:hypothetical protein
MTEDDVRKAIEAERGDLVEVLAGLEPARWDAATLCAGWRVREVVAHITMPFGCPLRDSCSKCSGRARISTRFTGSEQGNRCRAM